MLKRKWFEWPETSLARSVLWGVYGGIFFLMFRFPNPHPGSAYTLSAQAKSSLGAYALTYAGAVVAHAAIKWYRQRHQQRPNDGCT